MTDNRTCESRGALMARIGGKNTAPGDLPDADGFDALLDSDEVYVGIDRNGVQYVLPVQAKGGKNQLAVVQTKQDIACCAETFSGLVCRTGGSVWSMGSIICWSQRTGSARAKCGGIGDRGVPR